LSTFSDSLSHSFVGEGGERVTVFRTNDYSRCDVRHLSPRGKDAGTEAGATGRVLFFFSRSAGLRAGVLFNGYQ
jgi:hypothetical protein